MSQEYNSNVTANGLPIIYRDFESIGHIDSIIKERLCFKILLIQ